MSYAAFFRLHWTLRLGIGVILILVVTFVPQLFQFSPKRAAPIITPRTTPLVVKRLTQEGDKNHLKTLRSLPVERALPASRILARAEDEALFEGNGFSKAEAERMALALACCDSWIVHSTSANQTATTPTSAAGVIETEPIDRKKIIELLSLVNRSQEPRFGGLSAILHEAMAEWFRRHPVTEVERALCDQQRKTIRELVLGYPEFVESHSGCEGFVAQLASFRAIHVEAISNVFDQENTWVWPTPISPARFELLIAGLHATRRMEFDRTADKLEAWDGTRHNAEMIICGGWAEVLTEATAGLALCRLADGFADQRIDPPGTLGTPLKVRGFGGSVSGVTSITLLPSIEFP